MMDTMSKKRKHKQPGMGNEDLMHAMQELRFSNAARRHKSLKDYRRKPKHGKWSNDD